MIHKRICPQCNKDIEYPTAFRMKRSEGRPCKECKHNNFGKVQNKARLLLQQKESEILSLYSDGFTKLEIKEITGFSLKGITSVLNRNKINIIRGSQFTKVKEKVRKTNEESGFWVNKDEWETWKFYKVESNWLYGSNCLQGLTREDFNKIKEIGFYNPLTNKLGVVRDHKYSRRSGFDNLVFPEILRHPANLALLTNVENMHKWQIGKGKDTDSHSLEQLFELIENNNWQWREQEICLQRIKDYKSGLRWRR